MVDYSLQNLFYAPNVDKQLIITTDDGSVTITNTELHQESFELTESLCSESELTFGACEAAAVKFTISNVFTSLKDKWITVKMVLNGNSSNPFVFGRYKVVSDKPTADRTKREIEAYDALYDVVNSDVAEWYNSLLPNDDSATTLKAFRSNFFAYFGITQKDITLVNDSMTVTKSIDAEQISGADVLNCICEINGCMGHIGRGEQYEYIYLAQDIRGLYPSEDLYPSENLFPVEPKGITIKKSHYISAEYQDYIVSTIDKVQIKQDEDDIGAIAGNGNNAYVIQNNFLVYGKSADELSTIANNILSKIKNVIYRPMTVTGAGNPCIEVGDAVRLSTKYAIIESYVLNRTFSGIQALKDNYIADGEQLRSTQVNSANKSILQLKGKLNRLTRTVDKTKSEIIDVENNLSTSITQTAEQIKNDVSKTYETKTDAESTKTALSSSITQTANQIKTDVSKTYETKSDAKTKKEALESSISQTAEQISIKVSKDEVISEINQSAEKVKIKANKIELDGAVVANATLTAPTINGAIINGGAVSFGDNRVVANEDGIWVLGNGGVENPDFRVDKNGFVHLGNSFKMSPAGAWWTDNVGTEHFKSWSSFFGF